MLFQAIFCCFVIVTSYLWHVNRVIATAPEEATRLTQKPWKQQQIKQAYEDVQRSPIDVKPYLFARRNRRYVVVGGSGLVGGWIVQHLLMRGENPAAIRILDLVAPTRAEARDKLIFEMVDISDISAVKTAFERPWPESVKSLPLTVFHCVAYINSKDRHPEMAAIYIKVNVNGTENVLKVARDVGATCFVATSSASIALRPPSFFPYPWQRWPKDICQLCPNAQPLPYGTPMEKCASCYSWSKMMAEKIVLDANDPTFLTGTIRPGHAIYGHGVKSSSSLTYDYLRRGGLPTWIQNIPTNFVNAQNVSIGHLAYEDALLNRAHPGGKGYCVTDPNPPVRYGDLYNFLETCANPSTPIKFTFVPHVLMLLMTYPIEQYLLLRHRHLPWLPALPSDITYLQPAVFNMCTLHILYTDTMAQEEIQYKAPITTLQGFALALLDWNNDIDAKTKGETTNG